MLPSGIRMVACGACLPTLNAASDWPLALNSPSLAITRTSAWPALPATAPASTVKVRVGYSERSTAHEAPLSALYWIV